MQFVYQRPVDDLYRLFNNQWDSTMRVSIPISNDPMYNQHLGKLGCTFSVPKRTKWERKSTLIPTLSYFKCSFQTKVRSSTIQVRIEVEDVQYNRSLITLPPSFYGK